MDAARSQVVDGVEIVKPRIITGDWDSVTKKFPVAVEFTIAKGWHMYWLNPGDAGSPPEVKWALPMDWQVGKLQFPVPEQHIEDGFESYAYYDKLVLYSEITSPRAPLPNDQIEASIKWMVCKDICVAGTLSQKWPIEMTQVPHAWPKLPLVMTLEEAGYSFVKSNFGIGYSNGTGASVLEFYQNTTRVKIRDFFPWTSDDRPVLLFAYNGDLELRFSMPRNEAEQLTASEDQSFDRVNGLVFIDNKAYWLKAP